MCVALAALEAKVHVTGPAGRSRHRVRGFSSTARRYAGARHQSAPHEIITAIELPARGFAANYSYLKIRDRLSYAFALVSVAAALELDGGRIKEARLALGGVAHKPWRNSEVEATLRGQTADEPAFTSAADLLFRDAKAFAHNAFKIGLARRAIVRALKQAANGTPQIQSILQESPVSVMRTLYRHPHIARSTAAPRSQAQRNLPASSMCPVSLMAVSSFRPSPKGRIARIDASAALKVRGVLGVITHENRPKMANTDDAYHDDVAPHGSPFRPLYDDKIKFNGQPVALVVAEEWEIAQFAASLVKVDYKADKLRHRPACAAR